MPIETGFYNALQAPRIESPMNALAQAMQVQQAMSQNRLADLTYQQKQQQFDMIKPIFARMNGGGGNALTNPQQGGYSGGGIGSPAGGSGNPIGVPTDDGIAYSLQDLGALAAAGYPGAKEMLEVKKAAMQGQKFDAGSTYKIGDRVFTVPQLDKGMRINANGQVEAIPGYSTTNATIQGDQAAGVEKARTVRHLPHWIVLIQRLADHTPQQQGN
jgi:hypothetical protein